MSLDDTVAMMVTAMVEATILPERPLRMAVNAGWLVEIDNHQHQHINR
jgi:ADP-ribosylglycohydrolase